MVNETAPATKHEQVVAVFRDIERNQRLMALNPQDWHEPYRGQWVIIYDGKVIAHSPDGEDLAEAEPPDKYPGALLHRIPSAEELKGVLVV